MSRIIAIVNQKGGVGKTTTAVNLAACLANIGKTPLLIDLDPQGNASSGLGVKAGKKTVYEALLGEVPLQETVRPTCQTRLSCVPSDIRLSGAELELANMNRREFRLRGILEPIASAYDYILIDCPPSLNLLTVNALCASGRVLIPIQCEYYALEGVSSLLNTITRVRKAFNPDLEIDPSIPFVTIDRHCNAEVPCVSSDNFGGGRMAAEKLLSLGCKKLLFMRIGSSVSSEVDKRAAGFESICRMRNAEFESVILDDSETEQPFYRFIDEHIAQGKFEFDGIFCNTDKLACLIWNKLIQSGVRVPEDVQIIGYDGTLCHITGKPLCSSIVQPIDRMAEAAVSILLKKNRSNLPVLMALPVHYTEGGTTKEVT